MSMSGNAVATDTLESISPHDQSVVGEVSVSTKQDVQAAVQRARAAFDGWRRVPIERRIAYVERFRDLLQMHGEEIARLVSAEMGKPLSQSRDDISSELKYLDYYIEHGATNLADEGVLGSATEDFRVTHEPYGVVAVIAPWNFPVGMTTSGVIPALIAGNTVVFKPSEHTTLSQQRVIELLVESELPKGVVNLVIGDGTVGSMLLDCPVDLVWFTGSSKVGHDVYRRCGERFIKALCELGGSSPGVVFADVDVEKVVDALYWSRFLNAGQVCSAVKRLFVERPVYDDVVRGLTARLERSTIGNPLDDHDFGPLVSVPQLQKLEAQVSDAIARGARVTVGGARPSAPALAGGNYYSPTILIDTTPDMSVMRDEVFGPALPIVAFDSESEAVELANGTEYGLTAEVYTTDAARGLRMSREIHAGVVAINTNNYYQPACPIGGYKASGMGREYGRIGMQEFAQVKLVALGSTAKR